MSGRETLTTPDDRIVAALARMEERAGLDLLGEYRAGLRGESVSPAPAVEATAIPSGLGRRVWPGRIGTRTVTRR
jgi:hypothetical protein